MLSAAANLACESPVLFLMSLIVMLTLLMPSLPPGRACSPNLFELLNGQAECVCSARNVIIMLAVYNEYINPRVITIVGVSVNIFHIVSFLPFGLYGSPKVGRGLTLFYLCFIMMLVLELLCAVGFCGAELFFFWGALGLVSRDIVKISFTGYLLTPPDNDIIPHWVIFVNRFFRKFL